MFMQRHFGAGRHAEQDGGHAARLIPAEQLHFNPWKFRCLPGHLIRLQVMGSELGVAHLALNALLGCFINHGVSPFLFASRKARL